MLSTRSSSAARLVRRSRTRAHLCAAVLLLAGACSPAPSVDTDSARAADTRPSARTSVRGEAYFESVETLPADAIVRVELRDMSRADDPRAVIAAQEFSPSQGPPYAFELLAPDSLVGTRAALVIAARINAGPQLLFATDEDVAVPVGSASGPLRLQLSPVTQTLGAAPTNLGSPRGTPAPTLTVRCGKDLFLLAFESGAAYVTLADNSTIVLPRLTRSGGEDQEAPRTFTSGRMTFVQEIEGAQRISFARGRMVPAPCTIER